MEESKFTDILHGGRSISLVYDPARVIENTISRSRVPDSWGPRLLSLNLPPVVTVGWSHVLDWGDYYSE